MAIKIPSDKQIRELDGFTIQSEPISSQALMWRAAQAFVNEFTKAHPTRSKSVLVFCGMGNNGGDGLCIGLILKRLSYRVQVFTAHYSPNASPDFEYYRAKYISEGLNIHQVFDKADFPKLNDSDIVVDGLWGTGLSRPIEGIGFQLIKHINQSGAKVVSIDIPSGLNTNKSNDFIKIKADTTISFEFPKLSFFLPETGPYAGVWKAPSIGLSQEGIENLQVNSFVSELEDFSSSFPTNRCFSHKGDNGRALLMGSSSGMLGALSFAGAAAHAVGAGLIHLGLGQDQIMAMQILQPESMCLSAGRNSNVDSLPDIDKFDAICFGPGIGRAPETAEVLEKLISKRPSRLLIDADGLNLLSENLDWLKNLPNETILTPHPGEFSRLAGSSEDSFHRIEKAREFAKTYQCVLVLKDSFTQVFCPKGDLFINPTGNPVLSHGGSGDVLAGCITGLLTRGLKPLDAAKIGVYLHGLAADMYAEKTGHQTILPDVLANKLRDAMYRVENDLNRKRI